MARQYLVSITGGPDTIATTIWLTVDGLETGRRCKLSIPQAAELFETESGNTSTAADGSPFTEFPLSQGGGRAFDITIFDCPTPRFEALRELFDAAVAAMKASPTAGRLTVAIAGEPGSASILAVPRFDPVPVGFDRFSTGWIKPVILRMISSPNV